MFLKNRNIIFKMKISKVTDYAALTAGVFFLAMEFFDSSIFVKPNTQLNLADL